MHQQEEYYINKITYEGVCKSVKEKVKLIIQQKIIQNEIFKELPLV